MSIGKTYERDLLHSLRSHGHWAQRFTDRVYGQGNRSVMSPPDIIATSVKCYGQSILIECKAVKGKSIPLNRLSPEQCDELMAHRRHGGVSLVAVMFYEGSRAQTRHAFLIPIQAWVDYGKHYGRKSVALNHLQVDGWCAARKVIPSTWVGRKADKGPWSLPRM